MRVKTSDKILEHFRLSKAQQSGFEKLNIETIEDLLFHFPTRYVDPAEIKQISEIKDKEYAVLYGRLDNLKTKKAFRRKIPMAEGTLSDQSGHIKVIWFNQPYMAKMINSGSFVRLQGRVSEKKGVFSLLNPQMESVDKTPLFAGNSLFSGKETKGVLYPIYPETRGVTSNWLYHAIKKIFSFDFIGDVPDLIPKEILEKYHLPTKKTALIWIHTPKNLTDAMAARKRFAFEEIFLIQIRKFQEKKEWKEHGAYTISKKPSEISSFTDRFDFPLTNSQRRSIDSILKDFSQPHPMSRLLEGDVGSGKTAVAATAAFAIISSSPVGQNFGNLQVAYMVPTEILAQQHFESFCQYFTHTGISIGLITGSGCKKFPSKVNPSQSTNISRSQLLKWVAGDEIPILIGTHTLIQKSVRFKHLALVIIDEQHRFGTAQRQRLREKEGFIPHLLSMTATPIPRTLALTVYGDLDLSLLDELPAGRKWPETEIVSENKRKDAYERVLRELREGRQVYVICPRIEEPDKTKELALQAKSVKSEAARLKKEIFGDYVVGILHGKMTAKSKELEMERFRNGEIDVLVSTSVVEVGVNVPNATVIIIEGAERFGLAQLHQLRGRVMRSLHQPLCFVFSDSKGNKSLERLRALKTANSGFELSEKDLINRGAGDLLGRKQWGISDIAMEALQNLKMVEAAREEAKKIVDEDFTLSHHQLLKILLETNRKKVHFE